MIIAQRNLNQVDVRQPFVAGPDHLEVLVTDEPKAVPGAGVLAPAGWLSAGVFPNARDAYLGQRDVNVRYAFDPALLTAAALLVPLDIRDTVVFFACIRAWTGANVAASEPMRVVVPPRRGHGMVVSYRASAPAASWLRVPPPLGATSLLVRNLDDAGPARLTFVDPSPVPFKSYVFIESNAEKSFHGPGLSECWIYGDADARAMSFEAMFASATGV